MDAVSRARTRFRFAAATFFVPYLNCALSKHASSLDWVGLGGFVGSSDQVQEAGIEADCSASGKASYRAWYAMYPRGITTAKVSVHAGDSVTASVFYDATHGTFALGVTDDTTAGHFLVHTTCPHAKSCTRQSAEVISSAPATDSGGHIAVRPLADYGAVSFSAIAFTSRSGERGGLRSPDWSATRIIQTEKDSPFRVIPAPPRSPPIPSTPTGPAPPERDRQPGYAASDEAACSS